MENDEHDPLTWTWPACAVCGADARHALGAGSLCDTHFAAYLLAGKSSFDFVRTWDWAWRIATKGAASR